MINQNQSGTIAGAASFSLHNDKTNGLSVVNFKDSGAGEQKTYYYHTRFDPQSPTPAPFRFNFGLVKGAIKFTTSPPA